ncbi:MAG: DUF6273 domain-containing protein, partial [Eubacteriales bacterium]
TWLNNDFYNTAFNASERSSIITSTVVNEDNPWYGTDGGNNTSDKLFLLSYADTVNPAYGFSSDYDTNDPARRAKGSDFSKSNGLDVSTDNSFYLGNSIWWLRSPGYDSHYACEVHFGGGVYEGGSSDVNDTYLGVRPALKINLASDIITAKSGTGCVVDNLNGFVYGLDTGITSLDEYVDVAPGYELSYVPETGSLGSGTVVNVTLAGDTVESYTIIIFGDVNGDGNIDSIDAGTIVDFENDAVHWNQTADAANFEAGDLNGDGNIDSMDAGIAVDSENGKMFINQSTGIADSSSIKTGDIIEYGSYPQAKVTDESLITSLNVQTLSTDNTVTYANEKYQRVYFSQYTSSLGGTTTDVEATLQDDNGYYINTVYWFKFEPIQWRVLSNAAGEIFVMAEKLLDSKAYNQVNADVTWETCTIRNWLNNDFLNTAFNSTERAKIKTSTVVNEDNSFYGTEGGNDTNDKVFLPSFSEIHDSAYGFITNYDAGDTAREAVGSDFSKCNGLAVNSNEGDYFGNGNWWLRTPAEGSSGACFVIDYGIAIRWYKDDVNTTVVGVRPALKINL